MKGRVGEYLIACLESYGVRHVFGIPGVHTAEIYRGLANGKIRHITPRHEQGAGFMADGYARRTGKPGVCLTITGPGLTNIATAVAQARQDSIPLLVISGVNAAQYLGHRRGMLHELPNQSQTAASLFADTHTVLQATDIPAVLARFFAAFQNARPEPVHMEIPINVLESPPQQWQKPTPVNVPRSIADEAAQRSAARLLQKAKRPLLLVGGARFAAKQVCEIAERLDAPAVMTINGRGILPDSHPLALPLSPSLPAARKLILAADVVLAVGTELGETDYNFYGDEDFHVPGCLIRLDIDAGQAVCNVSPSLALVGDAALTMGALLSRLRRRRAANGAMRTRRCRLAAWRALSTVEKKRIQFLNNIQRALPKAMLIGDSTQAVYAGNSFFSPAAAGDWFNSATGYGTLGYALPAAIGAQIAEPKKPTICIVGDGGLQFSLGELGTAVDEKAPVITIVINNNGYGEIKQYMTARKIKPIGVSPGAPDFVAVARAYGMAATHLTRSDDLQKTLQQAYRNRRPMLLQVDERRVIGD